MSQKKAQCWGEKKRKASILPNCFSPLISLKTVNEQRERKFGIYFDYQMTRTVLGLCRARPGADHILPLWMQLLSQFALLCSTASFFGPQRNWVFAFYICFVQMSVKLFSMWACSYQEPYAHLINRQKKVSSCILHSYCFSPFLNYIFFVCAQCLNLTHKQIYHIELFCQVPVMVW